VNSETVPNNILEDKEETCFAVWLNRLLFRKESKAYFIMTVRDYPSP